MLNIASTAYTLVTSYGTTYQPNVEFWVVRSFRTEKNGISGTGEAHFSSVFVNRHKWAVARKPMKIGNADKKNLLSDLQVATFVKFSARSENFLVDVILSTRF